MRRLILLLILLLAGCSTTIQVPSESGEEIKTYFCPREDCVGEVIRFLNSSKESIYCAIYEINIREIISVLEEKSKSIPVEVIVDESSYKGLERYCFITPVKRKGIMHNKFCVVDGNRIFTGSFNPTKGGLQNNNNIVFVASRILAMNYLGEYMRIKTGQGKKVMNEIVYGNSTIRNYFCAEDDCSGRVRAMIRNARHSVYFMVFAFTDTGIANELILAKERGIDVKGVIEKRNSHNSSVYPLLVYQGIDVVVDKNKYNLHHKVFIIDNITVITGSFNPSANANFRNDENILVLNSVAKEFLREFEAMR